MAKRINSVMKRLTRLELFEQLFGEEGNFLTVDFWKKEITSEDIKRIKKVISSIEE